ncbi:MAG: hypothetical protein ACRC67_05405 [Inquilinus sp.]|uniref:hypothetical protein n=1 Tax=Inquilinus sp. TaxID=1932117 RepID=UPI003F2CBFB0
MPKPKRNQQPLDTETLSKTNYGTWVKLSLTHSIDREESKFIEAVSGGWPLILSNLKSLLETGSVVMESRPG